MGGKLGRRVAVAELRCGGADPPRAGLRLLQALIGEEQRLAVVAGDEEEDQRVAPPALKHRRQRLDVSDALGHLFAI